MNLPKHSVIFLGSLHDNVQKESSAHCRWADVDTVLASGRRSDKNLPKPFRALPSGNHNALTKMTGPILLSLISPVA